MPAAHNLCLWGCVHTYMCVVACVVESVCVLSPFHAYVKQNPPLNLFVSRDRKTGPFSSHLNKSMLHYTSLNKVGKRWFNPTINLDGIATLVSFPGSSPVERIDMASSLMTVPTCMFSQTLFISEVEKFVFWAWAVIDAWHNHCSTSLNPKFKLQ